MRLCTNHPRDLPCLRPAPMRRADVGLTRRCSTIRRARPSRPPRSVGYAAYTPMLGLRHPEDAGGGDLFLASDEARNDGSDMVVDGGVSNVRRRSYEHIPSAVQDRRHLREHGADQCRVGRGPELNFLQ